MADGYGLLVWFSIPLIGLLGLIILKFFGSTKKPEEGSEPEGKSDGQATRKQEKDRPVSGHFEKLLESTTQQQSVRKTYAYKPTRKSSLKDSEGSSIAKPSNDQETNQDNQVPQATEPQSRPPRPKGTILDNQLPQATEPPNRPPRFKVESAAGRPKVLVGEEDVFKKDASTLISKSSKDDREDGTSTSVKASEVRVATSFLQKPVEREKSKKFDKEPLRLTKSLQEVDTSSPADKKKQVPQPETDVSTKHSKVETSPQVDEKIKELQKPEIDPANKQTKVDKSRRGPKFTKGIRRTQSEEENPVSPAVPSETESRQREQDSAPLKVLKGEILPAEESPVAADVSHSPEVNQNKKEKLSKKSRKKSSEADKDKNIEPVLAAISDNSKFSEENILAKAKTAQRIASSLESKPKSENRIVTPSDNKRETEVKISSSLENNFEEINSGQIKSRKLASISTKGIKKGDEKKNIADTAKQFEKLESNLEDKRTSGITLSATQSAMISSAEMSPQVRVLTLNHNDHLQSTVFRLQKGYTLQFRPGPTLFGKKVNVFTNHPAEAIETFQRNIYRQLVWKSDSKNKGDDTSLYVEVLIHTAGSFHFYYTYDEDKDLNQAVGSGYFLVDPVLTTGSSNEVLPLDCIQCQTVMAKCLGTLDQWANRLRVGKESGYNMMHFTPVQKLGKSRSGYSLADQLVLNPEFSPPEKDYTMEDLEFIVNKMKDDWKVLSLTDIVLNHTANESPWLLEHPESTYNMVTAPHLRPAYVIDRTLYHFSMEVAGGEWESKGIPKEVNQEEHLKAIRSVLFEVLSKPRVEEFFMVDVDKQVEIFEAKMKTSVCVSQPHGREERLQGLKIIQDPLYGRNSSTVDIDLALDLFNIIWPGCHDEESRQRLSVEEFRRFLDNQNRRKRLETSEHLLKAVDCAMGTISYDRLQESGPKYPEVSKKHPFTKPYFSHHGPSTTLSHEEELSFSTHGQFLMAHNGWVMGHDPLVNFALEGSNVYLRRELIAWGDSVKLRYGDKPEDSPYLWDHMRRYVEETARIFHGIRLDNCHSTPIHVAEYLLDCARRVRPDLYVIAELFTNSDLTDNIFVNRLGINSLIREAMSAPDSHEEGRLVYRYGGEPVGAFILPPVRPLTPSIAHAIFLDLTHDNRSPCELRTGWDMLPSTALVNMACCASGSNRGYDEIVPHHIHVVKEERKYASWTDSETPKRGEVDINSGIIKAKKLINDLHFYLGKEGFNEVFVDQVTEHVVTVTRHNPVNHQSVVLVAFTSFKPPNQIPSGYIRPLKVQGLFKEIIFEVILSSKDKSYYDEKIPGNYTEDADYINGVNDLVVEVRTNLLADQSALVRQVSPEDAETTEFQYTEAFRPGSVIAFRFSLLEKAQEAVNKIRSILSDFTYQNRISEVSTHNQAFLDIIGALTLADYNRILYRCDQEERDEGRGWAAYDIPNFGPFVYCGLQGLISTMTKIRATNDLGHPICKNLRDGNWLPDYVFGRLKLEQSTEKLSLWLEDVFSYLKSVPRYLVPAYFDSLIAAVYFSLINQAWTLMGGFVVQGSDFVKALSLCSVQFCGVVKSSLLPALSPNLKPPQPPLAKDKYGRKFQASVTLSAGLPHFSTGYMRNWGRDTFIALPGNLLITGRYQEARWIILAFAATLRHGLIPNLLDGGAKARFNCRDAVWFWLYAIQQYVKMVPGGHDIFKDKVSRLFPKDDSPVQPPGEFEHFLQDVIQEALERHFQGIKFRERNAGAEIDSQMTDLGFNNEIGVDLDTGFPFGGNSNNCGTWMDKMGSSEKAGNKGKPATPRDGSAVEIVGLCKAALRFLAEMNKQGKYPYNGVLRRDAFGNVINWEFKFWETMITDSFEKYFWINDTPDPQNEQRQDLIHRRGIYKDSVRASQPWANYQLRCNFPIAMVAAPELFTPERAWMALDSVEEILLGPLGIKTLDPADWNYRGDYDNANDSSDFHVAKGFNYHQGPEWIWPVGFFLRARLAIASRLGAEKLAATTSHIKSLLAAHFTHVSQSPWRSLPELTNSKGSFCRDSNPAQSWSTGCILEVLYEMDQFESGHS